ncbi:hypothetical protein PTSG_00315 [Salpingoeca rosetta]|uniref:TLC domain-containing protein n=1 Tax=Salpingoeca rosetta (strain ATCC 50818 / BSB-021) TaxID=946362 RepID=F2TW49_SALR5|nr:uncharacterized protein PTSG_00315 [Salpingoeca rosetta]EGD72295.1 hypothetical protein PTSG_00315 [Salpingoeca rosetta]|eukprot:XP_004998865.1 hypothetical protein PTSG_00315 [Salpingoeca rosetta]
MAVDKSKAAFGLLHKPMLALVLIADVWIVFFPSPELGKYVMPVLQAAVFWAQNMVCLVTGDKPMTPETFEGEFPVATVIPLSLAMVLGFFLAERIVEFVSKRFAEPTDAPKFAECFVRCSYYTIMFFVALYVISTEDYWPNTRNCWVKSQATGEHRQPKPMILQVNYIVELSYYISGIVLHTLVDEKLTDFWIMLLHHVVTVCLLAFSYFHNFHRIGMLVLMVHDVSDIFLDSGKCFHFLKWESFATVTFVGLITSWAMYRLYLYPTKLLYSAAFEGYEVTFVDEGHEPFTMFYLLNIWLNILQVLHVYWFYLILKVAYKHLMEGELRDVRMEKDAKKAQ